VVFILGSVIWLNLRLVQEPSLYSEKELNSPQAVIEVMARELAQYDREVLYRQ